MLGSVKQRIIFDGDWTPVEQGVLERAIADAESLHGSDVPDRDRLWFCYCKRLDGTAVYMAHRVGWMRVLHAYGAVELGLKIRQFDEEPPDEVS